MQPDRSAGESYLLPVLFALVLHVVLFGLLFIGFSHIPDLPPSQPAIQVSLYQAKSQSQATTKTQHKIAGQDQRTAAPEYAPDQMAQQHDEEQAEQAKLAEELKQKIEAEKQAQEKAEAEAAARKAKADAEAEKQAQEKARKLAEAKAAKAKKEQEEAAKKAAEEKKKAEEAKKKAAEEKKKKAEEAKKKAAEEKKKAEQAKKKKAEAKRESYAEKKAQAQADLLSDHVEREQTLVDTQGNQVAGNIDDEIRSLAGQNWVRPPSARNNMSVTLCVQMLPDGTITSVSVVRSSGDAPYDQSAVSAVRSIGRVTAVQSLTPAQFAPYRSFTMTFTPKDLEL